MWNRKITILVLSILILVYIFSYGIANDILGTQSLVESNTSFALDIYNQIKDDNSNTFLSPYSISTALAMTYAGARGETAEEMKNVMHLELKQDGLPITFKILQTELKKQCGNGNELLFANGLCLTGNDVGGEYKELLREYYESEVFRRDLDVINAWASEKTNGRIENILTKLDPYTVCVLLSAVYFKGLWETQFDRSKTDEGSFTIAKGSKVKVPMMFRKGSYHLIREKDYYAIDLPYEGNNLSMVVLLPTEPDGLAKLESTLNVKKLDKILQKLNSRRPQSVSVYLPRFKIETDIIDLKPPLKALGMDLAFKIYEADFSGMGWPKGKLWIGQAKHRAFIEVNEEGTEAAGITALEVVTVSGRIGYKEPVFRVDHPFMFLIRDRLTGSILFLGRVIDPSL